jgi:hypothetical protein
MVSEKEMVTWHAPFFLQSIPISRLIAVAFSLGLSIYLEELPIRLAHRVKELNELPNRLNEMPSILKVRDWYAQSFEVSLETPL